jgi:hypothetical protein
MKTFFVLFSFLFVAADAFQYNSKPNSILNNYNKLNAKSVQMTARTSWFEIPGKLEPVGFFDPLGLSKSRSIDEIKKWREAELKHGRIAMLAVVGTLVAEIFHPLFGK